MILSPLLPPMAAKYGMDLVHFGIMMDVNLEIGYLTPPMGINLMDTTGAVLTFFFAIYYFQYHFANIEAQKKAMGHPAV